MSSKPEIRKGIVILMVLLFLISVGNLVLFTWQINYGDPILGIINLAVALYGGYTLGQAIADEDYLR